MAHPGVALWRRNLQDEIENADGALMTGRGPPFSEMRQVLIGLAAAPLADGLGAPNGTGAG